MSGIAKSRLVEERRSWRKDHPPGFWARPKKKPDGSTDLFDWEAAIPGKEKTDWAGGSYTVKLSFTSDYPIIFHPNVYPSGKVCLSILDANKSWKPSITLKQILLGVQDLLDNPNNDDPAQCTPSSLLKSDPAAYARRVRQEAQKYGAGASQGAFNAPVVIN